MPNVKSAIKRMGTTEKRADRNRHDRTRLRSALKRVRTATTAADALTAFADAQVLLDRFAVRGLIHRNKAARAKSRLSKKIAAMATA